MSAKGETILEYLESEYKLRFFIENDFVRKKCKICGDWFWTQNSEREVCGDAPCQEYTFIGKPPMARSYNVGEMRSKFLSFFEKNGHKVIKPYPVIARWREDIYVTIASIADFQPFVTDGIIPPPANPLVISQPCLRFTDIDNVGLTAGRHLTIFEMGGAHAFNYPDKSIYWKEDTVRYNHEFATKELGIKSEDITYKEGMWSGGGNAGPCVESCVNGLEVSTLVFMQYKVIDDKFIDMPIKIVDTGYGIERFAWLSQGTPSAFHAIYGPLFEKVMDIAGLKNVEQKLLIESAKLSAIMKVEKTADKSVLREKVANRLDMDPIELDKIMTPIECVYAIIDHTKALTFMLSEGIVPSNVKAGYLARLLVRRGYRLLRVLGIEDWMQKIIEMQIDYWSRDFPHINDMRAEILEALQVEEEKYRKTLKRGKELAKRIATETLRAGQRKITTENLIELYDSHGLPPEIVKEAVEAEGAEVTIPDNFYTVVAAKHISAPLAQEDLFEASLKERVTDLPSTGELYYENPYVAVFEAKVLRILDGKYVILDQTAFYPEGGGQPGDIGIIKVGDRKIKVEDTKRVGNIVVHITNECQLKEGENVVGKVDWERRISLMRHHTATHILTGSVRKVLGEHAWQAGAQKDIDQSRLDISHWSGLSQEQIDKIEELANSVVVANKSVKIEWMPRREAESMYGYRLYQGGVVPGSKIRVVNIEGFDVEACGGIHCSMTGDVGFIKVINTERIQDGVERIIFSAGLPAVKFVQKETTKLKEIAKILNTPVERLVETAEKIVAEWKDERREINRLKNELARYVAEKWLIEARDVSEVKLITHMTKDDDIEFLIKLAEEITKLETKSVFAAFIVKEVVKFVVMVGTDALKKGIHAGKIAEEVAKTLGGGGGGEPRFGQGGGTKLNKVNDALLSVDRIVLKQLS